MLVLNKFKIFQAIAVATLLVTVVFSVFKFKNFEFPVKALDAQNKRLWDFQCIDTMKVSRDSAREFLGDLKSSRGLIDDQMQTIQNMGATCVSIGTPYDLEFYPILEQWVQSARSHGLSVWFRGNLSGWEGWFDYPRLRDAQHHHEDVFKFIVEHKNIFASGDIFTPAPEAENGLLGNPWESFEARAKLNNFVIDSAYNCRRAFSQIKIAVHCGYFSANADVAASIYTEETASKTGGVIAIDHYVASAERMGRDINSIFLSHKAPVVIGEFGAPIPDINGTMSESQQSQFIRSLLQEFYVHKSQIKGINYWVLSGGSTALLSDRGAPKLAVEAMKDYLLPARIHGKITDGLGRKISSVQVRTGDGAQTFNADKNGIFDFVVPAGRTDVIFSKNGYNAVTIDLDLTRSSDKNLRIGINPQKQSFWYKNLAKLRKKVLKFDN